MRSNETSATAAARKSHARVLHARASFWLTHGVRKRAISEPLHNGRSIRPRQCASLAKRCATM
eukprot:286070-Lingulodinium_polyedra.AAC.1